MNPHPLLTPGPGAPTSTTITLPPIPWLHSTPPSTMGKAGQCVGLLPPQRRAPQMMKKEGRVPGLELMGRWPTLTCRTLRGQSHTVWPTGSIGVAKEDACPFWW